MTTCHKKAEELLAPFKGKPVTEELKKEVFGVLDAARTRREIKRRFHIEVIVDPMTSPYLEVTLEPFEEAPPIPIQSANHKHETTSEEVE